MRPQQRDPPQPARAAPPPCATPSDFAGRLEVEDDGRTGSIARRAPDLQDGGGFGLNVVEMLSARWLVNRDAGTRVWAGIAFAAAG